MYIGGRHELDRSFVESITLAKTRDSRWTGRPDGLEGTPRYQKGADPYSWSADFSMFSLEFSNSVNEVGIDLETVLRGRRDDAFAGMWSRGCEV